MSDKAKDLLIYGIAAAKAHSEEEARHYLEWALITDSNLEQQTEAWWWLSQIEGDPDEKRECLENVLAAEPTHPEARRDLAILEGRLKPEAIRDQRLVAAPVATAAVLQEDDVQRFRCPKCGGKMTYEASKGGLFCQFCGYTQNEDGSPAHAQEQAQEQDWIAAIYTDKGHRWELPMQRTLNCQGCGATVSLQPSHVSTECPFCGGAAVVTEQNGEIELIQPNGVALFAFEAATALEHARNFLAEQKFCPSDLSERAVFVPARPVYLPFWTFDVNGEATWAGVTPEHEYTRVRMTPTSGTFSFMYDDMLTPGTKSLPQEYLSKLSYDTSNLAQYAPELLADWPAEIYSVPMANAAVVAHAETHKKCRADAQVQMEHGMADAVLEARITNVNLSVTSYKHVLLPVWVTSYDYKGEQHALIVNGQNGQAHGSVPRNGFQNFLGEVFS